MHVWLFRFFLVLLGILPSAPFLVTYLFHILSSSWSLAVCSFWFMPGGYWLAIFPSHVHKSLAPTARTLLGVLGHITFSFAVVVALWFMVFCVCPKVFRPRQTAAQIFWGISEVGKNDFSIYFFGCASFSWFSHFLCCNRA